MQTRLLISTIPLLALLSFSAGGCKKECPQGYGLSADGECYPFDGEGDSDTDSDSDSDSDSDGDTDGLEVKGTWQTSHGEVHTVEEETWTEAGETPEGTFLSIFHIEYYTNDENYVVMYNDPGNDFGAEKWSRFHWAWVGDNLYFCPLSGDETSQSDAMNLEAPDDDDPVNDGCDDLAWFSMEPV